MNDEFQKLRERRIEILKQIDSLMDEGYKKSLEYIKVLDSGDEQSILQLRDEREKIHTSIAVRRDKIEEIDNEILLGIPPVKKGKLVDLRSDGASSNYTIYLHDEPVCIGRIEYRDYHCSEYLGDVGYVIESKYRNHGYATEALALLSEKLCEEGVPDFWVTVNDDNFESIRVIEKNGGQLQKTKLSICLYVVPTKVRELEISTEHRPK